MAQSIKMPKVGLGTFDNTNEAEMEFTLNTALELGYRYIDTAWVYANEKLIGKTLKKWFDSGKLKREDLFISTKLPMIGIHPEKVDYFMKKSLENLQLDYVDMYLVHFPVGLDYNENEVDKSFTDPAVKTYSKTDHVAIWKKMEEQVDAGRTKAIGLSNYSIKQIETVLKSARIKPANLQIEVHVFMQQNELVDFCHKNGMTVTAYSPLANPDYNKFLRKIGEKERILPNVFTNETIAKLAKKYNKSSAQIALKFLVQRNITPIPKSVTKQMLQENISLFDFELNSEEMNELKSLNLGEKGRVCDFLLFKGISKHPDFPFNLN